MRFNVDFCNGKKIVMESDSLDGIKNTIILTGYLHTNKIIVKWEEEAEYIFNENKWYQKEHKKIEESNEGHRKIKTIEEIEGARKEIQDDIKNCNSVVERHFEEIKMIKDHIKQLQAQFKLLDWVLDKKEQ